MAAQGRRRAWTVIGVAGGVPLLAALAVVVLLPDPPPPPEADATLTRPTRTAASRASREATTAAASTDAPRPAGQPADLTEVSADIAVAELERAEIEVDGEITAAWRWTDERGRSLLATVREVDEQTDDGAPAKVSLRAYYVTGLQAQPQVRRRLRDPSLSCRGDRSLAADFARAAFGVRDLDGDGAAEVLVGWTARCGDPTASSRVRLAVMAGSRLYVLRGDGVVTGAALADVPATAVDPPTVDPTTDDPTTDAGTTGAGDAPTPSPEAAQWPAGLLDPAMGVFRSTFY